MAETISEDGASSGSSDSEGRGAASTDDEYVQAEAEREGREQRLDELHTRLRTMYLEIQRNPQKYLDKIASRKMYDRCVVGPAHEIITDLMNKDGTHDTRAGPGVQFMKSQPSVTAVRVQNDIAHLEKQWDKLVAIQESGITGELGAGTPRLERATTSRSIVPEAEYRSAAQETEARISRRIAVAKERAQYK
eukprot:Rhum_TRINITY_DN14262_c8_g1::Rhum_TRINITY_DN14262_c8_g1_i1::g.73782::m.73782